MEQKFWPALVILICLTDVSSASENNYEKRFGATLGAGYEIGRAGNSDMDLKDRTMTALKLEGLFGYRLNSQWMLGPNLSYGLHQQQTSSSSVEGTNLAGRSWLLGAGTQYLMNEKWAFQGAIDFLGQYNFDKKTISGKKSHLDTPIGLRLKAQHFINNLWSADIGLNFQSWQKFHEGSSSHNEETTYWSIGLGLTYHFGRGSADSRPIDAIEEKKNAPITETEKSEVKEKLKIEGEGFSPYEVQLPAKLKEKLNQVAPDFLKKSVRRIIIRGYTDTSGPESLNKELSQGRAEAAKTALVEAGVDPDKISTIGMGPQDPIDDNGTIEGRSRNRRVEIEVEEEEL